MSLIVVKEETYQYDTELSRKENSKLFKQFTKKVNREKWANFSKNWDKGTLELKRLYNRVTKKKFFDHHNGRPLIIMDMEDVMRKSSTRNKRPRGRAR